MKRFIYTIAAALFFIISAFGCKARDFSIYKFDNGDDYFCEGVRRIVDKSGRIGFADEKDSVIIKPQFAFAFPFEDGVSKATRCGHSEEDGEYHRWVSPDWFYIDHKGVDIPAAELIRINGNVNLKSDKSPLKQTFITRLSDGYTFLSDDNGEFSVFVRKGDVLYFSYVGTEGATIKVGKNDSTLNVALNDYIPGKDEYVFKIESRYPEMETALKTYSAEKDARIGIAVIIDGKDTVAVNGNRDFPMLSVYKFPQAIAVADYCVKNNMKLTDSITISSEEIKRNTWSPLREKYGVKNLRLPLSELLGYSIRQSDNNACDILFRLIGGPEVADSLMNSLGFNDIVIVNTEDEMHSDVYLCYQNRSTPLAMARLFDKFYRQGMAHDTPVLEAIGDMMMSLESGKNRLPHPFGDSGTKIGHKTGTGDRNSQGRLIAVNDAGFVFLPNCMGYSIAVFVADSAYGMDETERIIADISEIVFKELSKSH